MDAEMLEKYRTAGKILADVFEEVRPFVEVDVELLEVAELVEKTTRKLGGEPAFPCNISIDRIAAHYTPKPMDGARIGEEMIKLDIGVHVDGYIADAAMTIDLSGNTELAEASRAALDAAIELVSSGVDTREIGAIIEETINGYGYIPVSNLSGHGLQRFKTHTNPTIPNAAIDKGVILEEGDVIAIEPFATDGSGKITEATYTEIYGLINKRPIRFHAARALMKEIKERFGTFPFARRWLSGDRIDYSLAQLVKRGILHEYPVLWEVKGARVSQAEHTLIVLENGHEVTTKPR